MEVAAMNTMNNSLPPQPTSSCARFQPLLALLRTDALSSRDAAQLREHSAGCSWCQRELAAYDALDATARRYFSNLPFTPVTIEEILQASGAPTPTPGVAPKSPTATQHFRTLLQQHERQPPGHVSSRPAAVGVIAAALIVGVVVAGFAALLSHRQAGPGATTGFNGDFGPPVLPTGPQPHLGQWRQLSLPDGVPQHSSERFGVTPQTSVPDLVYGCYQAGNDPQAPEPRKLWRSEDGGRAWTALNPPVGSSPPQAGCYIEVSPGAPDAVFLNGNAGGVSYYSLDRGDHWQVLQQPAGAELWDVAAPTVEGDVWYYIRTVGVSQPEIWVSHDHGAQWVRHMYPVRFPPSLRGDGTYPGVVPLLLRYEKSGLLILIERTLWWSPDYGSTWQKLETWSEPPCDRSIVGTPDLSVLYCVAWNGEQTPHPYWRSLNHGQTWTPVPAEPPTPSAPSGLALPRLAPPLVLHDGSLLEMATTPTDVKNTAYYDLAPNANMWMQASAPLTEFLGQCPQPNCGPLPATLAEGFTGKQYLYQSRMSANGTSAAEMMVGEITWGSSNSTP
jgi:hypothetical protein